MRNTHKIRNYFYSNIENTKLKCDICNAFYEIKVSVTNLKKHFAQYHKTDYQKILEKQKERFENIKEINHIQRKEKEKLNIITTQNNIQKIYYIL
ncbi:20617_t:CDS:1, partial [Cetraspora pellucida]